MAEEKRFTAKQAALAVLEKVGKLLKGTEFVKSEDLNKGFMGGNISSGNASPKPTQNKVSLRTGTHGSSVGVTMSGEGALVGKSEDLNKGYEGFKAVEESARKSGASDPAAVAAAVGRKKYGKEAFQEAAAHGKKMDKSEERDGKIREFQKHGLSPEQIEAKLRKEEDMEKHGLSAEEMKAKLHLDKSDPLSSVAGDRARRAEGYKARGDSQNLQIAKEGMKESHKNRLESIKATPAPKLGKSELETDLEGLDSLLKGETKHDRCVEHVKENSPEVKNPHAVCVAEGVKPAKWGKSEGYKPENSKKESAKPSEHDSKDAEQHAEGPAPKGEIHPKEHEEGAPTNKTREQADPQHNPKEEAEGNNELAGTTPTQVGQDGKNIMGYDEMKGHLKLAKFIGRMEHKRTLKKGV